MKQFLGIVIGIIIAIFRIIFLLLQFIFQTLVNLVKWFVPKMKDAGATAQRKLEHEVENLPGQMERFKGFLQQKVVQIRENMPEQKEKIKAMSQQGIKAVADTSVRMMDSLNQGANSLSRKVDTLKEPVKQSDDVMVAGTSGTVQDTPSPKKKYLWVALVAIVLIGGISSMLKKSDSHYSNSESSEVTTSNPSTRQQTPNSPTGMYYNNPGTPTDPSTWVGAPMDDGLSTSAAEESRIQRIEQEEAKARERERELEIKAMERRHRQEEQEMTKRRLTNMAGSIGID